MWKPEYARNRRRKADIDPGYRAKRNQQASRDPVAKKQYLRDWNQSKRDHVKAYRAATADERNRRRRERYAEDERYRERAKASARARDKDARRAARILAQFGISVEQYDAILAAQGGGCAICGSADADRRGHRLHIDHCHTTGVVRGILCAACNTTLGKFGDDAGRLRRAADYLDRFKP